MHNIKELRKNPEIYKIKFKERNANFDIEQFVSLEKVLRAWKKKYGNIEILGHRDIVNTHKTCPNFDVKKWCKKVGLI